MTQVDIFINIYLQRFIQSLTRRYLMVMDILTQVEALVIILGYLIVLLNSAGSHDGHLHVSVGSCNYLRLLNSAC